MEEPLSSRVVTNPNWFQKHINWSTLLFCLPSFFFQALANIVNAMEGVTFAYSVVYLIAVVLLFPPLVWALKQKKRSLWYLLLIIVPFGWIIFLLLGNKSVIIRVDNK